MANTCFLEKFFVSKIKGRAPLVHNCTIFLWSLDIRNIVQGGDPLYAIFFLHRALGAILDQNECVFLQNTNV